MQFVAAALTIIIVVDFAFVRIGQGTAAGATACKSCRPVGGVVLLMLLGRDASPLWLTMDHISNATVHLPALLLSLCLRVLYCEFVNYARMCICIHASAYIMKYPVNTIKKTQG